MTYPQSNFRNVTAAFAALLAVSGGCGPRGITETPPVVPTVTSTPPTLTWEAISQPQAVVIVEGIVGDNEQIVSTLLVTIASDIAGEVWRGNPRSDGRFAWTQPSTDGTYWLVAGGHQLTVTVTDSTDESTFVVKTVEVQPLNTSVDQDTGDTGPGGDDSGSSGDDTADTGSS